VGYSANRRVFFGSAAFERPARLSFADILDQDTEGVSAPLQPAA